MLQTRQSPPTPESCAEPEANVNRDDEQERDRISQGTQESSRRRDSDRGAQRTNAFFRREVI